MITPLAILSVLIVIRAFDHFSGIGKTPPAAEPIREAHFMALVRLNQENYAPLPETPSPN
jgi:hypothetical protein